MGYLLTDHESARPCSAVMLGPQRNPVNSLIFRGLRRGRGAAAEARASAFVMPESPHLRSPVRSNLALPFTNSRFAPPTSLW
jgi:hypothetical protein